MTGRAINHFQSFADARRIVPVTKGGGHVEREIEQPVQEAINLVAAPLVFCMDGQAYMTFVMIPYVRILTHGMDNSIPMVAVR